MTPGYYILNRDMKNPKPHRAHKHNWTKQEVWKAGGRFAVVKSPYGVVIHNVDSPRLWIYADSDQGRALIGGCTKTSPETVEEIFRYSDACYRYVDPISVLEKLVELGVLTVARVAELEDMIYREGPQEK